MNFYYTDRAGAVAGPISREQLQTLVDAGSVGADSQVCFEGSEDWKPLHTFVQPTPKSTAAVPAATPAHRATTTTISKTTATPNKSASTGSTASGAFTLSFLTCVVVALLGWIAYQSHEHSTSLSTELDMIKRLLDKKETKPAFEYMIAAPYDRSFDTEMNLLGLAGWEIVSARRATSESGYSAKYEVILRRQIR